MIDPRRVHGKQYVRSDLRCRALCAGIGDAHTAVSIANLGVDHATWFRTGLRLPHGIPAHDTFDRVLPMLDPPQQGPPGVRQ